MILTVRVLISVTSVYQAHGLSQDLGTGCPKLPIVKSLGVLFFKEDHIGVKKFNYMFKNGILKITNKLSLSACLSK